MEGFRPADALRHLVEVEGYKEGANARAAGITWMVWGLAFAASVMTYPRTISMSLLVGMLPLVAAAVMTRFIWLSHASEPETALPLPWSLALLAAIAPVLGILAVGAVIALALAATIAAAALGIPSHWSVSYTNPLPGVAVWAVFFARGAWAFPQASRWPGWLLAAGLFALGLLEPVADAFDLSTDAAGQIAAVAVLAGFLAVGSVVYRRG